LAAGLWELTTLSDPLAGWGRALKKGKDNGEVWKKVEKGRERTREKVGGIKGRKLCPTQNKSLAAPLEGSRSKTSFDAFRA